MVLIETHAMDFYKNDIPSVSTITVSYIKSLNTAKHL